MSRKRKVAIGLGALVVVFIVAVSLGGGDGDVVEVRVEDVTPRDLVARVTATGHVEPKTSIDISADVSGRIVRSLHDRESPAEGILAWDTRDDAGRPVAAGVYWALLTGRAESTSRQVVVLR